jgi:8-hydroxy-5-deazaflavin:NADPH oxidoreductase
MTRAGGVNPHLDRSAAMKFAIIGAGNVGKALGTSLTRAGHTVSHPARGAERAAVADAEAVVLAVPWGAVDDVTARIAPAVAGKLVIDATNPLKPDYSGLATEGGPSGAEHVASRLPGARVVKAFNTVFATVQGDPSTHGVTIDALFATDDDQARREVARLLRAIGFRPVDVGPLARARELEAIAFLNISLQVRHSGDWRTAITLVGPPAAATPPSD